MHKHVSVAELSRANWEVLNSFERVASKLLKLATHLSQDTPRRRVLSPSASPSPSPAPLTVASNRTSHGRRGWAGVSLSVSLLLSGLVLGLPTLQARRAQFCPSPHAN